MSHRIINSDDLILVTGGTGFIGRKVVEALISLGFTNIRCLARSSSKGAQPELQSSDSAAVHYVTGNLLSRDDCKVAAEAAKVIYHLAAGTGTKSFADAFLNSVVTTRNLLDAAVANGCLRRFVSISSFAVYTNNGNGSRVIDEQSDVETTPESRADPYCFAKSRQDSLVMEYGRRYNMPYVLVRPGTVYGPGKEMIPGRVGIDTFGLFLHLGGPNRIPLTYVDNCADAIALAGITPGVEGEVFNVVDDDLPLSRQFLARYKKEVRRFSSIYVPHAVSYALCYLWEKYSAWSEGQLAPVFNHSRWNSFWKRADYSNRKIKERLGWTPRIATEEGLTRYFTSCREKTSDA